jgi:hypothetical protein
MKRRSFSILLALLCASVCWAEPHGKIKKVLPHFLDEKGRHTVSPSLFERDQYQAELRKNPERRSGIRFDTQWKVSGAEKEPVRLKLEVRGSKLPPRAVATFEASPKKAAMFSRWSAAEIAGEDYKRIGEVIAWRVTLWAGEKQVAEQKSFLW